MSATLAESYARVRLALSASDRDPLGFWRHSSRQTREATALLSDFDELYARAANKAGKTEWEYAVALAMLQKRPHLDGVPLPQWTGRVEGVSLEIDYPTQKLSSQQTILRLLGDWPHHASWKGDGYLATLRIQPLNGSSDQSTWSTLTFMSQENRKTGTGIRADLVLANEPPVESIWREIRKAAHAGRRIVRIIGATPIHRRQWQWLKDEYGNPPRGTITRHADWAEVRWSINDNRALTGREVDKLLREYGRDRKHRDPLYDARVYGDYIDTSGLCPFDIATLYDMLAWAEEQRIERMDWRVTREVDTEEDGRQRVHGTVPVLVARHPERGRRYYLDIDPSAGIEGRDPGAILVSDLDTGEDVALHEGFLGTYGLGVLAAGLARQYNDAVVDPESNGGWSEGVLRGLADSGYANIARTRRALQPGKWETKLGFENTHATRGAMISELKAWIDAWAAGRPYARCPFSCVIQTLLDTIMEDEKIVAGPGYHDEFLILKGQSLRKTRPRHADPDLARPAIVRPPVTREMTFARLLEGSDDDAARRPLRLIPKMRR